MKTFRSKAGNLCYTVQGTGPITFLLVHNAGGSHEMMHHTTDYFSKKSKVIVPDLLGHGASDAPRIEYTVKMFAETLIQLCQHELAQSVIFVGLNYGADVGIDITKIAPSLISHLVLIDPPFFMEPWIREVVEHHIKDLHNSREESAQETVDTVIIKTAEHEKAIALKALKQTPAFVRASTYEYLLIWDKKHSFSSSIPTLMIQASNPFCREGNARTVFSRLQVGRVVGSGPWVNLEVPPQAQSMIDRFLEI